MTIIAPRDAICVLQPHDHRLSTIVRTFLAYLADNDDKDLLVRQLESLNLHMMEWQHESGTSLQKLWELPEESYKKKVKNLNEYLEWKLHRFYKANTTVKGRQLAKVMRLKGKWDFDTNIC